MTTELEARPGDGNPPAAQPGAWLAVCPLALPSRLAETLHCEVAETWVNEDADVRLTLTVPTTYSEEVVKALAELADLAAQLRPSDLEATTARPGESFTQWHARRFGRPVPLARRACNRHTQLAVRPMPDAQAHDTRAAHPQLPDPHPPDAQLADAQAADVEVTNPQVATSKVATSQEAPLSDSARLPEPPSERPGERPAERQADLSASTFDAGIGAVRREGLQWLPSTVGMLAVPVILLDPFVHPNAQDGQDQGWPPASQGVVPHQPHALVITQRTAVRDGSAHIAERDLARLSPLTLLDATLRSTMRRLLEAARTDATTAARIGLWTAVAAFVLVFTIQAWSEQANFGTFGFDLGIYAQAVWLLAHGHLPFVTVRGLNIFALGGPGVLALIAPLYMLWANPRLLLLLQVIAMAVPAVVIYRLAGRWLRHPLAGLVFALAYLAEPGMQWATMWQFHPQTLAAAFLILAVDAADRGHLRTFALWAVLAITCSQGVALIVLGLGLLIWRSGQRSWGRWTVLAAAAAYVIIAFVLVPLAAAGASTTGINVVLQQNEGITSPGPLGALADLPALLARALSTAVSDHGIAYLLLVFGPLALLPLRAPKWLLPVAAPLIGNLGAVAVYQQSIRYQYLATSAPLLGVAAAAGLVAIVRTRPQALAPGLAVVLVIAGLFTWQAGDTFVSSSAALTPSSPLDAARAAAVSMIPPTASVSAQYEFVPHLANRTHLYEWPNPFRLQNYGVPGEVITPGTVNWVIVDRSLLTNSEVVLLDQLEMSSSWRVRDLQDGVVVLQRVASVRPLRLPG